MHPVKWVGLDAIKRTCMSVDVVLQRGQRLEAALADGALVRPLLRVRLHVPRQEVPLGRRVVAVVAHVRLGHLRKV
jgi:hypothetical protein